MVETIEQNEKYSLYLEFMGKQHGGWWLEVVDRVTGNVKILTSLHKEAFEGTTIDHVLRWMKNEPWKPMYKENKK